MIWRNNLSKENQLLKQQLESVQLERNQLRIRLRETREELARVRLDFQDQIDDLQDHVENLKTFIKESTATKDANRSSKEKQQNGKESTISNNQQSPTSVTTTQQQRRQQQLQSELSTYLAGLPKNESIIQEAEHFEMTIMANICHGSINNNNDIDLLVQFIRRMMVINLMRRWMTTTIQPSSSSELDLYETISRLLLNIFGLERCSYAYYLDDIDGNENSFTYVFTHCTFTKEHGFFINSDEKVSLDGTAIEHILKTKQSYIYYPCSSRSPFSDHAMFSAMGYETVMNIPIYLDNFPDSIYAILTITVTERDSLNVYDRLILTEIAKILGDNVSSLRFQSSTKDIQQLSQYLLYSHCPEPVMKKLQKYWDNGGVFTESDLTAGHTNQSLLNNDPTMKMISTITNTHDTASATTATDPSLFSTTLMQQGQQQQQQQQQDSGSSPSLLRALYAYSVYDVCIVFADIDNLSQLNATMSPIDVMDVLQQLVSKFDLLHKKHRILKVESSVGSFVGASGIIEDSTDYDDGDDDDSSDNDENDFMEYLAATSPQRALAFAKDLILAANTVSFPTTATATENDAEENMNIVSLRVGIHWGDSTCGILRVKSSFGGLLLEQQEQQQQQDIPKFTILGQTIDVASKIQKSCPRNKVMVSDDFFHLVESDVNVDKWDGPHIVPVKDTGTVVPCWHCNPYFEK